MGELLNDRTTPNEFKKSIRDKILKIPDDMAKICEDIYLKYSRYSYIGEITLEIEHKISANFKNGTYKKLSDVFKGEYKIILDVFIEPNLQGDYLHLIDKLNRFQLGKGSYGIKSIRSYDYTFKICNIFGVMYNVSKFSFLKTSLVDILKLNISDYMYEYIKRNVALEDVIEARLDFEDSEVENVISEIISGKENVYPMNKDIIRGIIKSDNQKMHKLLGDLIEAEKVKEDILRLICENINCGVDKSFVYFLDIIDRNNLIRFSFVRSSFLQWIDIYNIDGLYKVAYRMINKISKSLQDKNYRLDLLNSRDKEEFFIGLWSTGFYNIQDVCSQIDGFIEEGNHDKLLALYYYLNSVAKNSEDNRYFDAAKKVLKKYNRDLKLVACYKDFYEYKFSYFNYRDYKFYCDEECVNKDIMSNKRKSFLNQCFKDKEEAFEYYKIFVEVYNCIDKKEIVYSTDEFPYEKIRLEKSKVAYIICNFIYMMDDEDLIDQSCEFIKNVDTGRRGMMLMLLLRYPVNNNQRNTLISFMSDRDESTYKVAFDILNSLDLKDSEYKKIEKLYTRKTSQIRANATWLILKSRDEYLTSCIDRLLKSSNQSVRMGGLDILLELSKNQNRQELYEKFRSRVLKIKAPTDREKSIIDLIYKSEDTEDKKYNLYNSSVSFEIKDRSYINLQTKYGSNKSRKIFKLSNFDIMKIMEELSELIEQNKDKSFVDRFGAEYKLGDKVSAVEKNDSKSAIENLPFSELWIDFYKNHIKDFDTLFNIKLCFIAESNKKLYKDACPYIQDIFGKEFNVNVSNLTHASKVRAIIYALFDTYKNQSDIFEISKQVLVEVVNRVDKNLFNIENEDFNLLSLNLIRVFLQELNCYDDREGFIESFLIKYQLDLLCDFNSIYFQNGVKSLTNIFDYIKLYELELIDQNMFYKVVFENLDLVESIKMLNEALSNKNSRVYDKYFAGRDENCNDKQKYHKLIFDIYLKIMSTIISEEIKRGDGKSDFTKIIKDIEIIYSSELLVQIINGIGNEKIERGVMNPSSRIDVLSYLLKICKPLDIDNADKFKQTLKSTKISKQKLIEVAMYNPIWADIIGESIGLKDLKSGCYYFIAHANIYIDKSTEAIIKQYTPLETDELKNGAFDIEWFKECYESLGKENFDILYKSAKYVSHSYKHSRARYFCDAVTGKLDKSEVKNKIIEKRNKDMLIAYALIPIEGEQDLFERYEYIQQFLKESKKFGPQRRNSEKIACEMAIKNLAINSGYGDDMRLILYMEAKLSRDIDVYFKPKDIDDITVRLMIDDRGMSFIECIKNGRKLKGIPAKYKKNQYIIELKEVCDKLKNQHDRVLKMMEEFMESRNKLKYKELSSLMKNYVTEPILRNLVFVRDENTVLGFLREGGFIDFDGNTYDVDEDDSIRVAHSFDLYENNVLDGYKNYLSDKKIEQPFKQVFRELYLKSDDELDKSSSFRYSNKQIPVKKSIAILKSRRWICDYEIGLHKVFYKENIIADIIIDSDWFYPDSTGMALIEEVYFYDRKSFNPVKISQVTDIIYSEVMRDVDLLVNL